MTFILPGTKPPVRAVGAKENAAYEEAKAARHAARARDKRLSWTKAVKQVSTWTPSMAVEALTNMPPVLQQQYLLAEECNLNRAEVLRYFPAVAPSTRRAWAELATPPASPKRAPRQRKEDT